MNRVFLILIGMSTSMMTYSQTKINEMEKQIEQVIIAFEDAAAQRNTKKLQQVLHPHYRVVANRFKGTTGTTIISRGDYLKMMDAAKIGGTSYKTEIIQVSIRAHTAIAEVLFKADQSSDMHKYLFLVQDDSDKWQIVGDLPLIIE